MNQEVSWHALSPEDVVVKFNSNKTRGLSHNEVIMRRELYGNNSLPEPKARSLLSIFGRQFLSPLIYLLLAAAMIAFFIGESKDAFVILFVVILNAVIGAFQEGRAEYSLQSLRRLSKLRTRVLRDGCESVVHAIDLVVGDILVLSSGDAIPADARLLECSSLMVAEGALTGESVPIVKLNNQLKIDTVLADRNNMVYMGTHVTFGRGLALVVSTGVNSEVGKIATLTTATMRPKTQLEVRIEQFGRYLVVAALCIFALVVCLGLLRGIPFLQIFMIGISQMVSAVPEGLPVAMTVALAVGVQRMARRKTIVRSLSAVEALGSTTIICTDKTGTLTRNEMTVTAVYLPERVRAISVSGVGYAPEGSFFDHSQKVNVGDDKTLQKLFEICCLCNDSQLLGPEEEKADWRVVGDPTEGALLTLAAKGGLEPALVRNEFPRIAELSFNSEIKMMATQHKFNGQDVVLIKGAPETVLDICSSYYCNGSVEPLGKETIDRVHAAAEAMADSALRVLAFGYVENTHIDGLLGYGLFAKKVILVGLVGQEDPPRSEIADSIRQCRVAGIRPVMVTGDHKATAIAIAKALGMSTQKDLAVDGREIDLWSEDELLKNLDQITVFARVHPAQKLRIVEAYQKKGEVVAMTGDGVNDAPALVRSNVGVAMGVAGTEVAKEASKIIITDDNFATILTAISEGRLVYQNLKKLILFLFVTSLDEVVILFLALTLGYSPPLAAVQILWINLIAEGTLAVNLIMEPPEGDEMHRPPTPPSQPLLDRGLISRIPIMMLASVISTFGWFVYRSSMGVSSAQVQTETFTVLAICQWFNVLNCRANVRSAFSWGLWKNLWLLGALILSVLLHAAVIYWHPLGQYFHTVPIAPGQLFAMGVVASLVIWVEEVRKVFVRLGRKTNPYC